jgi:hypothetical protein
MTEQSDTGVIINTELSAIPDIETSVGEQLEEREPEYVRMKVAIPELVSSIVISNITHNTTFRHTIENVSFGNLPPSVMTEIFKDGRAFSHFIEAWLAINYPLIHIKRCKQYDHTDVNDETVKYDQKTFTKNGCKYMPSNMIGEGRTFNQEIFEKKANQLIYIIVSNVHFPEIMVRFVRGCDLIVDYPTGNIPFKDFDKFFN